MARHQALLHILYTWRSTTPPEKLKLQRQPLKMKHSAITGPRTLHSDLTSVCHISSSMEALVTRASFSHMVNKVHALLPCSPCWLSTSLSSSLSHYYPSCTGFFWPLPTHPSQFTIFMFRNKRRLLPLARF